jgi:hypothetical protein
MKARGMEIRLVFEIKKPFVLSPALSFVEVMSKGERLLNVT